MPEASCLWEFQEEKMTVAEDWEDVHMCTTMSTPGGGSNSVSPPPVRVARGGTPVVCKTEYRHVTPKFNGMSRGMSNGIGTHNVTSAILSRQNNNLPHKITLTHTTNKRGEMITPSNGIGIPVVSAIPSHMLRKHASRRINGSSEAVNARKSYSTECHVTRNNHIIHEVHKNNRITSEPSCEERVQPKMDTRVEEYRGTFNIALHNGLPSPSDISPPHTPVPTTTPVSPTDKEMATIIRTLRHHYLLKVYLPVYRLLHLQVLRNVAGVVITSYLLL